MRGACFLLVLFSLGVCSSSSFSPSKSKEWKAKLRKNVASKSIALPSFDANVKKQEGRVFYPIGYGADPTGTKDSSVAILSALDDAFKVQIGLELLSGINDLGGAVIDFQGGNYRIDQPIVFPASGGGNVAIRSGTLRASEKFPGDRYLIELQSPKSQNGEGTYYEDITFHDILFDSNFHGGGVHVIDSVRIRVNNCYFLHFSTQGILVERGHETFISNTFLGQQETVGGDPRERNFTGTAIELAGNDNTVTDVAIFSAAIGVLLRGQANILTGVHCYNKATGFGGIGILVQLPGNSDTRIVNCYMDYNAIILEDPVQVIVSNVYFLGDGNIVLKSIKGRISGLHIVDNMFTGDAKRNFPIVQFDGEFTDIDQVVVDRNTAAGMALKSTVGKLTVAGNGTKWDADFSQMLLFPNKIDHLQYSFYVRGKSGIPSHAVTNVSGNTVTVESNKAVDGVVSVEVDQYNRGGETSFYK